MKIALIGKMRTGKDTLGKYLCDEHSFNRFAFGDGIKEVILEYFPTAFDNGKPREHYQFIGQAFRQLDPDIWVNRALGKVNRFLEENPNANIVITDVRQPNEAKALRAAGFLLVKVESYSSISLDRILKENDTFNPESLKHETEVLVDSCPFDIKIFNNGTLEELYLQGEALVSVADPVTRDKERNN